MFIQFMKLKAMLCMYLTVLYVKIFLFSDENGEGYFKDQKESRRPGSSYEFESEEGGKRLFGN